MMDHAVKRVKSQCPLSDLFMTVLMARKRIFAVVDMNGPRPVKSDHTVKLIEDIIQMPDNIVPCIVDMTGIKAYTHMSA